LFVKYIIEDKVNKKSLINMRYLKENENMSASEN